MNMPPNYDIPNGPVMNAAKMALDTGNVNYVLIWVPEESENQIKNLFEKTVCEHRAGKVVQDIAINWYLETVKRLHRAGERALYTCMNPDGPDESPVILKVNGAIETGEAEEIIGFIPKTQEHDFRHRFHHLIEKKNYDVNNVAAGREYVAEFIDFILYLHHLCTSISGEAGHPEH
jgi:Family of unknown function (DUF6448)